MWSEELFERADGFNVILLVENANFHSVIWRLVLMASGY